MTQTVAANGHKADVAVNSESKPKGVELVIPAPNFQTVKFKIAGTAPLVVHKFSEKSRRQIMQTQLEGNKAKSKKIREPRDFDNDYMNARHISTEGWDGVPASAFRSAMIAACRTTGFVMARAKQAILYIEADGTDATENTPLVRIYGTPKKDFRHARNDNGSVDLRVRPMWTEWHAYVRVKFDADMLTERDIANLMLRAGQQVGICEGRPASKNSDGVGWGTFALSNDR